MENDARFRGGVKHIHMQKAFVLRLDGETQKKTLEFPMHFGAFRGFARFQPIEMKAYTAEESCA